MPRLQSTTVATKSGKLKGAHEEGLYVFKGVRFAAPPLGELRWLPPQPVKPWKGVRDARKFGTVAPQPPSRLEMIRAFEEVEPQSEDCLFLNVWTPGLDNKRRPVMVWIHGGAFSMGSGSAPPYRSGKLAARGDIVLVTTNYRLGVLGFLNLNEVTNGKIPATGNEGLLDQVSALEWVRDNIAAFGGDPDNVTIFGESAGGMSVGCLLAIPKAQGLFHKAIIESAVGNLARPLAQSVKVAGQFLEILGIGPGNVEALRALPTDKLLSAQMELAIKTGTSLAPAIPVADGKVMPKMPIEAIAAGSAKGIPLMVGSNLDEEKLFAAMMPESSDMDEPILARNLERQVAAGQVNKVIDVYRSARGRRGEPTSVSEISSAIQTDLMFRLKAIRILEGQCKYEKNVYAYLFTWKSPALGGKLGACHALEIGFVYGNMDENFCGTGPDADRLSLQMQDAWTAFARNGDPSTETLGPWPSYCAKRQTMMLGAESRVEEAPYDEERLIWQQLGEPPTRQ